MALFKHGCLPLVFMSNPFSILQAIFLGFVLKEKNPFTVYVKSFYLTMGLADLENVISRTGFKSHVLHSLKEKSFSFIYICNYFSDKHNEFSDHLIL